MKSFADEHRLTCRRCGRIETDEEIRPGNWTAWHALRYLSGYFKKWSLCSDCAAKVIEFVEGEKPKLPIMEMPEIIDTSLP